MSEDRLKKIFDLRQSYMVKLQNSFESPYPDWPLDMSKKESQIVCRETALKGVEEMFEALGHLKNWKPHRQTEIPEINKEEFLEEIVDSFNYFFSLIILTGFTPEEFFDAYCKKDIIIRERIDKGY